MTLYVGMAGAFVKVEGLDAAGIGQFLYDLEGYYDIQATDPPRNDTIASVALSVDQTCHDAVDKIVSHQPYRDIAMHYPSDRRDHRFGRLATVGDRAFLTRTTKRSNYILDQRTKCIQVFNPDPVAGAKEVRRLVRDQLLQFWMEAQGACIVHSASVVDMSGRGTLVVGGRGSGKTSFFMAALADRELMPLGSERTALLARNGRILMYALPEKINFFPGTLAQFSNTAALVTAYPESQYWERSSKLLVHWQEVFRLFGRRTSQNGVPLCQIVFPRYGSSRTRVGLDETECRSLFEQEILTESDPVVHNNWLGWFRRADPVSSLIDKYCGSVAAWRVEWDEVDNIGSVIKALSAARAGDYSTPG